MHTRRNRRRPVAVAAALTVALAAAGAGTAAAGSGAPSANLITWSGDHLALGDSVAFGYRPMQITPTATYKNAANFAGYAENLQRVAGFKVVNASCPGETTRSFLTAGAPSNGCQNGPGTPFGYRTAFPLHTAYAGTQLAFAVDYLKTRKQFGVTLSTFQALTFRAADMYTRLELASSVALWASMVARRSVSAATWSTTTRSPARSSVARAWSSANIGSRRCGCCR